MPEFIVFKKQVWVQGVRVEAEDKQEALLKVAEGGGIIDKDLFEYSHTLNFHAWDVEETD
jgi:hypothetical protein